jgi:hypothetical protein
MKKHPDKVDATVAEGRLDPGTVFGKENVLADQPEVDKTDAVIIKYIETNVAAIDDDVSENEADDDEMASLDIQEPPWIFR